MKYFMTTSKFIFFTFVILLSGCERDESKHSPAPLPVHNIINIQDKLANNKLAPALVVVPAGSNTLGDITKKGIAIESPTYKVTIKKAFAIGKYEVTFEEYDLFCEATGRKKTDSEGWGRERRPVIGVTWYDARDYAAWLTKHTGKKYFLPSEAQWEYASRAGTTTSYWWGNEPGDKNAQCGDCAEIQRCVECKDIPEFIEGTVEVGSFKPNRYGLFDSHGNVSEWTADCGSESNSSSPSDGSPRLNGDCSRHIIKDGSWSNNVRFIRSSVRISPPDGNEHEGKNVGFRVAREIIADEIKAQAD